MLEAKSTTVRTEQLMSQAGKLFILTAIITLVFSIAGLFLFLPILDIISSISLLVSILVLGFVLYHLTSSFPPITKEAKKVRILLLVFAILEVLTSIFILIFVQALVAIIGLAALFIRALSFTLLDQIFRRLDDDMGSTMFVAYGWFGVIVVVVLFITVFSTNANLIIAFSIIATLGEVGLLTGMGIKLLLNAKEIAKIDPRQVEAHFSSEHVYCTDCGHLITESDMNFCSKCGSSLKPAK